MAQTGRNLPLAIPRLAVLFWTWCWGIIGGSVGLNSVIKRNQMVARVKNQLTTMLPSGAQGNVKIYIDTHDLEDSGIVLAVGCTAVSVLASLWIGLLLLDMFKKNSNSTRKPLSTLTLPIQCASMAFMSIWLIACLIPVTYFAVQGGAKTTISVGDTQIPQSFIDTMSAALGLNSEYWSLRFVRLQIIPPWITMALTVITTAVLFGAALSRPASDSTHAFSGDRISKEEGPETLEKHDPHAGDMSPISPVKVAEHHEHEHAPGTGTA